jgi:hypothetical protein
LIVNAPRQGWILISTDYCAEEAKRNLAKVGPAANTSWRSIVSPAVEFTSARFALDKPLVFPKAKDRPVVISALAARCEWLLTLDEIDFHGNLGQRVYGMLIATPGEFFLSQRKVGVL